MGHLELFRGSEDDILFRLRKHVNGPLSDDDDWVAGSTAPEWPVVRWLNSASVDVTSSFAKDVTGDATPAGWVKHPVPSTGLFRESEGEYRARVVPSTSLPTGTYTLEITADLAGDPFVETHTVTLSLSGDVEFGDAVVYSTEEDVLDNFELEDVVTASQVLKARLRADRQVNALYRGAEIVVPQVKNEANNLAAIAFSQIALRRLIASASIPPGVQSIREGDTEMRFRSSSGGLSDQYIEALEWMEIAYNIALGSVSFVVTDVNRPPGRLGRW